ncbi:MAG TPA: M15 family metallopeptidase [Labilithrix sp.]|nr:M15 family metallopeptidase [Labilithrix sp.]
MLDPRRQLRTLAPLVLAASALMLSPLACSGQHDEPVADHHDDGSDEGVSSVSAALSPSDSVTTAVAQSCTTTAVKGLSTQLVEEVQCLRPGTLMRIDKTAGLSLGTAVFPYLQAGAAKSLIAAQKARGTTMSINSALRTLPQQYLLYRWYQTGRCGIGLAASPGTSNHEGAIAVDINDNAGWRSAMLGKGFRWLGASDPVHYDFVGGGTVDLRGLSVKAFQRLWNRNNPTDLIAEDGDYGPSTATRLAKSPSGGFAKGASCTTPTPDAGADAGADVDADPTSPPVDVPSVPDATEPSGDAPPAQETTSASLTPSGDPEEAASGCALAPSAPPAPASAALLAAGVLGLALARRRRRGPA